MVGGANIGALDTVELLGIKGPLPDRLKSRRLSKFPVKIGGAAGATLGDASLPHICGGHDGNNVRTECYVLHPQSFRWNFTRQMSEARWYSGSANHPDHGWVIAGGYDYGPKLSAEQTKDGRTFQSFASLPLPLYEHGLVSLGKGGGRGDFFLVGGYTTGNVPSKKAFIYDTGSWREVADIPTARVGLICGPIRSRPDGPVEKVVAAGGSDGSYLSTTEIYDLATDSWSKGTPLPMALDNAAIVPYETTFLVVGGYDSSSGYSDKVFLYETSGEWSEQPHMKLSKPKQDVTAMLVPSSLFD